MKINRIIVLFVLISSFLISCKKDYPADIPEWVQKRIKNCKRSLNCCYKGDRLRIIEEKTDKGLLYYHFIIDDYDSIYNYNGNLICVTIAGSGTGSVHSCPPNAIEGFVVSDRYIWYDLESIN